MSDPVVIRPLDRCEVAAGIDQFVAVARDVPGEYWSAKHFLLELPEKWILSLAAWSGEVVVDYAIVSRKSADTAHLHHFMVAANRRGQGLGARLLTAAAERCRDNRCTEIGLKVAASSVDAQRFYRQHGFDDVGGDDNYRVMLRRLK